MMLPTIHLNGTNGAELFDRVCEAMGALRRAMIGLEAVEPNGRDYYPQGPEAYGKARDEHVARMTKLKSVMGELQELSEAIADGGAK